MTSLFIISSTIVLTVSIHTCCLVLLLLPTDIEDVARSSRRAVGFFAGKCLLVIGPKRLHPSPITEDRVHVEKGGQHLVNPSKFLAVLVT